MPLLKVYTDFPCKKILVSALEIHWFKKKSMQIIFRTAVCT
jgi:hypothetical protein